MRANHNRPKGISRKHEMELRREHDEKMSKIKPIDLFKNEKYSEWDSEGVPIKDASGEHLSKSAIKKLKKTMAKHVRKFQMSFNEFKM